MERKVNVMDVLCYDELSKESQERCRQLYGDINAEGGAWADEAISDAAELGINMDEISLETETAWLETELSISELIDNIREQYEDDSDIVKIANEHEDGEIDDLLEGLSGFFVNQAKERYNALVEKECVEQTLRKFTFLSDGTMYKDESY